MASPPPHSSSAPPRRPAAALALVLLLAARAAAQPSETASPSASASPAPRDASPSPMPVYFLSEPGGKCDTTCPGGAQACSATGGGPLNEEQMAQTALSLGFTCTSLLNGFYSRSFLVPATVNGTSGSCLYHNAPATTFACELAAPSPAWLSVCFCPAPTSSPSPSLAPDTSPSTSPTATSAATVSRSATPTRTGTGTTSMSRSFSSSNTATLSEGASPSITPSNLPAFYRQAALAESCAVTCSGFGLTCGAAAVTTLAQAQAVTALVGVTCTVYNAGWYTRPHFTTSAGNTTTCYYGGAGQ